MEDKRNEVYVEPTTRPTRLVWSAVLQDGKIWTGKRHGLIIPIVFGDTGKRVNQDQQGFLTDDGWFVSRKAGEQIAWESGQIPKDFKGTLLSEDLW
jgi:hypothetical protein